MRERLRGWDSANTRIEHGDGIEERHNTVGVSAASVEARPAISGKRGD
jgi:hypothetical protein